MMERSVSLASSSFLVDVLFFFYSDQSSCRRYSNFRNGVVSVCRVQETVNWFYLNLVWSRQGGPTKL